MPFPVLFSVSGDGDVIVTEDTESTSEIEGEEDTKQSITETSLNEPYSSEKHADKSDKRTIPRDQPKGIII